MKNLEQEFESLRADYNFVYFIVLQVYSYVMSGILSKIIGLISYYFVLLYLKGKIKYVLWNFGKKKIINTKIGSDK